MTRRVCCCFPLFPLSRRAAYVGSLVVKGVLQAGGSRLRELGEGGLPYPSCRLVHGFRLGVSRWWVL